MRANICRGSRVELAQSSTPFVKAGFHISRGKYGGFGYGTASLIVRKKGAASGGFAMTCAHVLGVGTLLPQGAVDPRDMVYAPKLEECCGIECNNPFGTVVTDTLNSLTDPLNAAAAQNPIVQRFHKAGTEQFAVDAALILLDKDTNSYNRVPEIGQIAGVRDLIAEWGLATPPPTLDLPPTKRLEVRKYGATTKLTAGLVRRLARQPVKVPATATTPEIDTDGLVLEIEAKPGQDPFKAEYELDLQAYENKNGWAPAEIFPKVKAFFTSPNISVSQGGSAKEPTLKIVGHIFSQPGDSGAPIVDGDGKIIGLLRSGTFVEIFVKNKGSVRVASGESQAVFIVAALERLGVEFLAGGQHAAGAPIVVPGMPIQRGTLEPWSFAGLDDVREAIERTPAGARLAALVRRHADEARRLVHHRRRVSVAWHRSKASAFLGASLRAVRDPDAAMPLVIDGVRLVDALRAMRDVLVLEGSSELRTDLTAHGEEWLALADRATSFADVIDALTASSAAPV